MTKAQPISSTDLYLQLGTDLAPVLIDVRADLNSDPDRRPIVSARPMPVTPEQWTLDLESGQHLVVYDSQGDETSEGVAEALSGFGKDAHYLGGGFAAWVAQGLPTRRRLAADVHKWIPDVEFTHEGERCSFDTFLRLYDIADPPLERLALIVRGADTSRHHLTPQCAGSSPYRWASRRTFPTITKCTTTAW
jgi:hypothetical protein